MWKSLRARDAVPDHAALVAAYCYLQQGELREAVALVDSANLSRVHVAAETLSWFVFGGEVGISAQRDRPFRLIVTGGFGAS